MNSEQHTVIDSLLNDPEVLAAAKTPPDADAASVPTSSAASDTGGSLLSSLLSSPDILAKLPNILSLAKLFLPPQTSSSSAPATGNANSEDVEKKLPAPSHRHSEYAALLLAIKPFIEQDKAERIDALLKFEQLFDLIDDIKR